MPWHPGARRLAHRRDPLKGTQGGASARAIPLNIPGQGCAREVVSCGSASRSEVRKLKECALRLEPGVKVRAPILADSAAHLGCRVIESRGTGGYVLFTAENVLAVARNGLFEAGRDWNPENSRGRFLLPLGGPCYASPDRVVELDLTWRPAQ